ncbi:sensor histidine kinase [Bacillus sp. DX1.1]|uniref:sensor histidine kinase n=1 Tax=unclassified Bacillus (in: firmicutes) TaxID=185979 RepID=UPI00256FDF2B|nr:MULTISPECIES: sensor histidine kinase [unclassified Bacillus (in: firmicutes)]MDM5153025.1 sensor histidine kinase [Bacillus sp. DX1.1]WJE82000.1 sensor histidine kinase [Bacillus sp. DX3.1]
MLGYARLLTLVFICVIYALHVSRETLGLQIFVGVACFVYFINHVLLMMSYEGKWRSIFILLSNGIITAIFGFLFPQTSLYLIIFGIEAVGLFINVRSKAVVYFFVSFFFLSWFTILLYTYLHIGEIDIWNNVINFMFVVFSALAGGLIRKLTVAHQMVDEQYEKLTLSHAALQEAHEQLQLYAKEVEELTSVRERNDIAREIHDTVGHNMTALLVQLQLAEALWKQKSDQTEVILHTCHELARKSLQEVRASVRTLKEEQHSGNIIVNMREMLEEFSKGTDVQVTFQLQGDPIIIPLSLQPTLLRIMQESLTNAKRHGKATICELALCCLDERVVLSISDNGIGVNEVSPGFGLINMKERIEEHGGLIRFESEKEKGFRLKTEFPLREKMWIIGGTV